MGYQDFGGIDTGLIGATLARLGEKRAVETGLQETKDN